MNKNAILIGLLFLVMIGAAEAADTYSVTVTDERAAALADRTRTINTMRARAAKGLAAAELTPAQVLQRAVDDVLDQWDAQLLAAESSKPWADKSPRAKAKHCEDLKLSPCPK